MSRQGEKGMRGEEMRGAEEEAPDAAPAKSWNHERLLQPSLLSSALLPPSFFFLPFLSPSFSASVRHLRGTPCPFRAKNAQKELDTPFPPWHAHTLTHSLTHPHTYTHMERKLRRLSWQLHVCVGVCVCLCAIPKERERKRPFCVSGLCECKRHTHKHTN